MESCYLLLIFTLILDNNLTGMKKMIITTMSTKMIEMKKWIKGLFTMILTLENSKLQLLYLIVDIIN